MAGCELCAGGGTCPGCGGVGSTDVDRTVDCQVCSGSGWCPNCTGTGEVAA